MLDHRGPGLLSGVALALAVLLGVGACAPAADASPPPPVGDPGTPSPAVVPPPVTHPASPRPADPTAEATADPIAEPPALPDDPWRTTSLRDVRSGETLVVNDLVGQGRLVVIEPMAIWCTNCRIQQNETRTALASLGRDDIVHISLDVDPNETEADLARYADQHEYPWHFVVASRDVARSLALAFGDQVLSPPSTPKIIVARDGSAEVSFGIKRADDLEAQFAALLP